MDIPNWRLKADHIEVDFDTKRERNEPQTINRENQTR